MSASKTAVIEDIVDQHFEEASFLWSQRDAAVTSTNYTLADLVFLDERVEAHIDGLRVAGDYGLKLCESGLDPADPGTVFTSSIIAFESGDKKQIDKVVGVSNESRVAFRAVVSGLGWMNTQRFNALIMGMVSARSRSYRRLGIAACGKRRVNPKTYLDQATNSSDLFLKTRAFKTAGELKRLDLLPRLQEHFQDEDHACRFEAARSALLLGDRSAVDVLSSFILSKSRFTLPAMMVALRIVDTHISRNWLKTVSTRAAQRRHALIGTGIVGDPMYVPMLIKQMAVPKMARLAGNTFSIITGVNLNEEKLEGESPEGFEAGPNDDAEDDNVEMDPDEDLSWPDPVLVTSWWEKNGNAFQPNTRYLAGRPITPEQCSLILRNGTQLQREAAALELTLMQQEAEYFNTKARGGLQLRN